MVNSIIEGGFDGESNNSNPLFLDHFDHNFMLSDSLHFLRLWDPHYNFDDDL